MIWGVTDICTDCTVASGRGGCTGSGITDNWVCTGTDVVLEPSVEDGRISACVLIKTPSLDDDSLLSNPLLEFLLVSMDPLSIEDWKEGSFELFWDWFSAGWSLVSVAAPAAVDFVFWLSDPEDTVGPCDPFCFSVVTPETSVTTPVPSVSCLGDSEGSWFGTEAAAASVVSGRTSFAGFGSLFGTSVLVSSDCKIKNKLSIYINQTQVSHAGINNYIPQYYLSLPKI